MPLLKIQTSVQIDPAKREAVMKEISACAAEVTGKPQDYIMVFLGTGDACMAGTTGPAAFVDVRAIGGVNAETNGNLSQRLCGLIEANLSIPADRIYITFTDVPAANWGWDSKTFG